jgi:NADH-quinone oxidoreductase subunit H
MSAPVQKGNKRELEERNALFKLNPNARLPMERVAAPRDRHFRMRMAHQGLLNANPRKSGVLNAVIGYAALFGAAHVVLILAFQVIPALLTNGLPFPWTGFGLERNSFWFNVIYGILAPVLAFLFVAVVALINILMLRKYLGKVQNRYGPLHNGPSGSLQTVYDALKLVSKEDHTPKMVEETIFTLAPVLVFVSAFVLMAVIPFAPGWVFANVDAGAIFIIAAGTLGSYGVLLAGWSMNNKFGLMGGLRAAAQLVSYEVPLSISLLSVCVYAGTMNLSQIVNAQQQIWFALPLFIPFVIYLIAGLAEIKMTPFDLPEAESELVAGFNTEYGGMRFGFFFVAEFAELYLLPAILAVFFLGGWHMLPLPETLGIPIQTFLGDRLHILGYKELFVWGADGSIWRNIFYSFWFLVKGALGVYFYMWIRATLPRFRDDQLMELCWKGLIPLSLIGLMLAAFSKLVPAIGTIISVVLGAAFLYIIARGAFFPGSPKPSSTAHSGVNP